MNRKYRLDEVIYFIVIMLAIISILGHLAMFIYKIIK
jgi:hypothetical protein